MSTTVVALRACKVRMQAGMDALTQVLEMGAETEEAHDALEAFTATVREFDTLTRNATAEVRVEAFDLGWPARRDAEMPTYIDPIRDAHNRRILRGTVLRHPGLP